MKILRSRVYSSCPVWMIPMVYVAITVIAGLTLPRLEHEFFGSYSTLSVSSAEAVFSSIASGMMAFTSIVFSLHFIRATFGAMAFSPRVVTLLVRDPFLFHSLGIFTATFGFAIAALAWTDRGGSGKVPLFSGVIVIGLLILSMLVFGRLVEGVTGIQITRVLQTVGNRGRQVILDIFPLLDAAEAEVVIALSKEAENVRGCPVSQTLLYIGEPKAVVAFDVDSFVQLAKRFDATISLECAVGDTLSDESVMLKVFGGTSPIPEIALRKSIRLANERTFEQDPKYPLRLLVDIAIRALSPAVNDPTTAVQAIDQIEDLLRRLGRRKLGAGYVGDDKGVLRVFYPTPTWDDYLTLAFDEIRQYGSTSIQVMRRMRSTLRDLAESLPVSDRRVSVQDYIAHMNTLVERYITDPEDRIMAMQEDRQGLGLSR